mgnify:CR=1 FL=1
MRRFELILCAAGLLAACAGLVRAEEHHVWDFNVQALTGQDAHWTSPEPVDPAYLRYYARSDAHILVESKIIFVWVSVYEADQTGYSEGAGPIPPGGTVFFQDSVEYADAAFTVTADVVIWADADGYLHVDILDLESNLQLRITVSGTVRVKATDTVYGDWNLDGVLDATDVHLCASCLAGMIPYPAPPAQPDLDGDGTVSSRELVLGLNFAAGNLLSAYVDW